MKLFSPLFMLIFSLNIWAQAPVVTAQDLHHIAQLRFSSESEIVRKALREESEFRQATHEELLWFSKEIRTLLKESGRGLDEVKSRVLERMRQDLATMKAFNSRFAQLSPSKGEISWSCQANKLVEIISEAIPFYDQAAENILDETIPTEFLGYWDYPRCLGACEKWTGNHNARELALKASLLLTLLELKNQMHLEENSIPSFEASPIVHTTPLPPREVLDVQKLGFFYNGTLSPNQGELGFVHGGYAFGGQNDDTPYKHLGPYGKPFGPQDCSSWMSKLLDLPSVMSTIDFAAAHQDYVTIDGTCSSQTERFRPVYVETLGDVQAGMFLVTRRFDLAKDPHMTQTLGTSGHALLVIDVDLESQTLLTLEYARNLPLMEGFGVRRLPFSTQNNVKSMYFVAN